MNLHSALDPIGSDAVAIARLWWWFLGVSTVVYLLVIAALLLAMRQARRRGTTQRTTLRTKDRRRLLVGGAMSLTVLVLLGLLAADFVMGRRVLDDTAQPDALRLRITAQQFWWQLEYEDVDPSLRLVTANEIVVPVGRRIELSLAAADVIHSFWLPNVAGKKDLIPGITNTESFIVQQPGRYEGQCAEYCGYQHAKMRTILRAVTPEDFERWKAAQLQPGRTPQTPEQQRGQTLFMQSSCALCHNIGGTAASGTVGPDLTHLASRDALAAGVLPNTDENLAAWVRDPQRLKPGVNMPSTRLGDTDLAALVAYLNSLR
jgi:cytochrome c oxidase subunit 2